MPNIDPWLALLFGIVLGVVLMWLMDSLVFGLHAGLKQKLSDAEAKIRARDAELRAKRTHIDMLQRELQQKHEEIRAYRLAIAQEDKETTPSNGDEVEITPSIQKDEDVNLYRPPDSIKIAVVDTNTLDEDQLVSSSSHKSPDSHAHTTDEAALAHEIAPMAGPVGADDLTEIKGIGPTYAEALVAAGISSFATLASTNTESLRSIVNAPAWRQVDYVEWIIQADRLATTSRPKRNFDDLTVISGIGPRFDALLKENGIKTFEALASTDKGTLANIIKAPDWRAVDYASWIEQAKSFTR